MGLQVRNPQTCKQSADSTTSVQTSSGAECLPVVHSLFSMTPIQSTSGLTYVRRKSPVTHSLQQLGLALAPTGQLALGIGGVPAMAA